MSLGAALPMARRVLVPLVVSAVIAIVAWYVFLAAFDINPLVGKRPQDVASYLFTDAEAGANRSAVVAGLRVTLGDAALGFVGGLLAASVVACVFVLSRSVEQTVMPAAMLLRSVPLVAMTPLISLVFGRGLTAITVIGGVVVFFPALVTIAFGLRSISPQARDLVLAYGGSEFTVLRRVCVPAALPAFFAAARISVPGSLIGALVAEWLVTGDGLGRNILRDIGAFGYGDLWSSIVVLTGVSLLLYTVVGLLESLVLSNFGDPADGR